MLKTATFTVMHFAIAFSVAYALTGSVAIGGLVAIVEPLVNSVSTKNSGSASRRPRPKALARSGTTGCTSTPDANGSPVMR
ncbi:hypothetical protein PHLH8_44030 [Pseudomonas sp. Pc102]|nr:hypothetical protein PHLH8_44030 [Pseudomonas sp. Pc102]